MLFLLVFIGLSRVVPRPLSAVAFTAGGDVTILREQNETFRVFRDGALFRLYEGDIVVTQSGVMTVTAFSDQTAVISPGAYAQLIRLDDANGGTQVAWHLRQGQLQSIIDEHLTESDSYIVSAPALTASVDGTNFIVEVFSENRTRVTTVEGEVTVAVGDQAVQVQAGQQADAIGDQALVVRTAASGVDGDVLLFLSSPDTVLKLYAEPDVESASTR